MPNLLIRNLPSELHAKLKASAEAHRRSINQETIATLLQGLEMNDSNSLPNLPPAFRPTRPITMKQTLKFMNEGQR
jgi:plasmid stability protein